ncbi:MAG: phage holin family protein [Armatimonadota bacterium]
MESWSIKAICASVVALCASLLGGWDILAQAMLAVIVLDVAAGLLRAGYEKRLNSSCMRKGLFRKAGYFVAVLLAVMLDCSLFNHAPAARTLVISYVIVNESLSVLEHLAAMGVPLPAELKEMLMKLRNRQQEKE